MDGVAVCVQNYAYWMQKKVGGVSVITPNVPGADYSVHEYEVLPYFSVPVPFRKPYVTGLAEIDPAFLKKIVNRPMHTAPLRRALRRHMSPNSATSRWSRPSTPSTATTFPV